VATKGPERVPAAWESAARALVEKEEARRRAATAARRMVIRDPDGIGARNE